jgi:hypothetical protein
MDDWESPSSLGNEKLLSWLASGAEGPAANGMEFHGYELHAHPDLLEPLDQLGEFPVRHVAAFGIPALAHPNGLIFVFAFGSRYLYFRNVELPSPEMVEELGLEWQGLDPWFPPEWTTLSLQQRLAQKEKSQAAWMYRVRQYAHKAYLSVAAPE